MNIQKAPSLTCDSARLPAPIASTMRFGSTSPEATSGSSSPAAVSPATVAEPTHTRIAAVTSHARISGSRGSAPSDAAIALSTPVCTSTSLKAPEPPIMRRIEATSLIAAVYVPITSGIDRPRIVPSVTAASPSVRIMTRSGSARNLTTEAACPSGGTRHATTVAITSNTAGRRAVTMLTAVPGSFSGASIFPWKPSSGAAGMLARNRENSGPAMIRAGTATTNP